MSAEQIVKVSTNDEAIHVEEHERPKCANLDGHDQPDRLIPGHSVIIPARQADRSTQSPTPSSPRLCHLHVKELGSRSRDRAITHSKRKSRDKARAFTPCNAIQQILEDEFVGVKV